MHKHFKKIARSARFLRVYVDKYNDNMSINRVAVRLAKEKLGKTIFEMTLSRVPFCSQLFKTTNETKSTADHQQIVHVLSYRRTFLFRFLDNIILETTQRGSCAFLTSTRIRVRIVRVKRVIICPAEIK